MGSPTLMPWKGPIETALGPGPPAKGYFMTAVSIDQGAPTSLPVLVHDGCIQPLFGASKTQSLPQGNPLCNGSDCASVSPPHGTSPICNGSEHSKAHIKPQGSHNALCNGFDRGPIPQDNMATATTPDQEDNSSIQRITKSRQRKGVTEYYCTFNNKAESTWVPTSDIPTTLIDEYNNSRRPVTTTTST